LRSIIDACTKAGFVRDQMPGRMRVVCLLRGAIIRSFGFARFTGSGKTTLIEKLIPRLCARGLRMSLIKRDHPLFGVGRPGKCLPAISCWSKVSSANRSRGLKWYDLLDFT
jgi:hypothetical protein